MLLKRLLGHLIYLLVGLSSLGAAIFISSMFLKPTFSQEELPPPPPMDAGGAPGELPPPPPMDAAAGAPGELPPPPPMDAAAGALGELPPPPPMDAAVGAPSELPPPPPMDAGGAPGELPPPPPMDAAVGAPGELPPPPPMDGGIPGGELPPPDAMGGELPPPGGAAGVPGMDPNLESPAGQETAAVIDEVLGLLEPFEYDGSGRRDPFKPFIRIEEEVEVTAPTDDIGAAPKGPLLPLQRFDLNELRLTGIIWDVDEPQAMFVDPSGKTYRVGVNSRVGRNNGYVAVIREGEVVVVESVRVRGEVIFNTKVIRLLE